MDSCAEAEAFEVQPGVGVTWFAPSEVVLQGPFAPSEVVQLQVRTVGVLLVG